MRNLRVIRVRPEAHGDWAGCAGGARGTGSHGRFRLGRTDERRVLPVLLIGSTAPDAASLAPAAVGVHRLSAVHGFHLRILSQKDHLARILEIKNRSGRRYNEIRYATYL
jgi:hypothetical protein